MNYNKNYLSKRPFLVVTTKFLPAAGAKTQTADWAEKSGWNVMEDVAIVDRVATRHHTTATLIVDVLEAKCIKNGFRNSTPDEAMTHYLTKYKDQVKEAMGVWLERQAYKMAESGELDLEAAKKEVQEAAATAEPEAPTPEAPAAE